MPMSDKDRAIRLLETNGEEQYVKGFCAELAAARAEEHARCVDLLDGLIGRAEAKAWLASNPPKG